MTDAERQFLTAATDLLDRLASCLLTWQQGWPICPLCGFVASIDRRPEQDAPGEGGSIPHRHYVVRATARLYEARDTLRRLWGDEYAARIAPNVEALRAVVKGKGKGVLETAIEIAGRASKEGADMAAWTVLAVAVEDAEPTAEQTEMP